MIPISKPYLTKEEAQNAYDTILSGWVMQGPKVDEFEKKFCEYTGAKYAAAVSNGTTALHLSMLASGIGKDDEVICPSMSFIATANCIRFTGAKPVFAEVNPKTYNIDIAHTEKLITDKTKAILIVHQVGMPADIDAFTSLAKKYNLKLIEDAACAAGSSYKGKKIGIHSETVCFSFHPRKVITTGEGGMITCSDPDILRKIKLLRSHGAEDAFKRSSDKFLSGSHIVTGYNYRLTDIQASIGICQLGKLDWIVNERRKIASKYFEGLKDIECIDLPFEDDGYFTNYQSFCIYLKNNSPLTRNELIQKLKEEGISAKKGITCIHKEPAYSEEYGNINLPVSEDLALNSFFIPIFVPMKDEETGGIIDRLRKYLKK